MAKIISIILFTLLANTLFAGKIMTTGYIEPRIRMIGPENPGRLIELLVEKGTTVSKGQPLYILEGDTQTIKINEQKQRITKLKNAIAAYIKLTTILTRQLQRRESLSNKAFLSKDDVDKLRTEIQTNNISIKTLEGDLLIAENALKEATLQLKKQTVYANESGIIQDIFYHPGEYILSSRPVLSLINPDRIRVIFYIPQNQINHIKLGQSVTIKCSQCKNDKKATINYISTSAEFTPPIMYSEDQRSRLVFLIEAKFMNKLFLNPGQPVTVVISGDKE